LKKRMTTWLLPPTQYPPELLDYTAITLLARRGLPPWTRRAFLDPHAYRPSPPETLPDMTQAVSRLGQAIERQELICVWGDFDVDGQSSTALLVSTLRSLGANVRY
jgi:single-stranded-DNA-specific exonuclease